jgi:SAM-dependent methyltransferase
MKPTRAIRHVVQRLYTVVLRTVLAPSLARERRTHRVPDERAVEYAFALQQIARLYPGCILDVGPGKTAFPHLLWTCGFNVTAVDKNDDPWTDLLRHGAMFNRHFDVIKDDITTTNLRSTFDLITCVSVLEHIPDHGLAMRRMWSLLKSGGHLVLTCPFSETSSIARLSDLPDFWGGNFGSITRIFCRDDITGWLRDSRWEIVKQEFYQLTDGRFYCTGIPIVPPLASQHDAPHQLTCLLLKRP